MLIPSQGALGASAATLVAYIALFLFQGMCARKYTDLIGNSIRNIPFVLIGFLMYLLIRNISFGNGIMTVIVRVIIGVSVKAIIRAAKERRPGALGYSEAMIIEYNKKSKFRLSLKTLYGGKAMSGEDDFGEE